MTTLTPGGLGSRFLRTTGAVALATVAAYLLWLGWHGLADASQYAEWRVGGLAVSWAAIVIVGTWRGSPTATGVTAVLALTAIWCADAATTPSDDASLWPIGALFLLTGSTAAAAVLVLGTAGVRVLRRGPRSTA